jgi:hypothetical protein
MVIAKRRITGEAVQGASVCRWWLIDCCSLSDRVHLI